MLKQCCQSCITKDQAINELDDKVSGLSNEVETLKMQRDQHEKALRYLFQKVELLLLEKNQNN